MIYCVLEDKYVDQNDRCVGCEYYKKEEDTCTAEETKC